MTIMKDDRLQLRVDAASKRRLGEAASEAHLSVSAFVLQAANQAAVSLRTASCRQCAAKE